MMLGQHPAERARAAHHGVAADASEQQRVALADRLHFDGTPTFVINGQIIVGELTDAELQLLTKQPAPKG